MAFGSAVLPPGLAAWRLDAGHEPWGTQNELLRSFPEDTYALYQLLIYSLYVDLIG